MASKTTATYANGSVVVHVRHDASSCGITAMFYNGVELEPI